MKKINIAKVIWISSVFLALIVILIMVMDYKIHYQYLTKNQIYFYECSGNLCVSEVKDDSHLLYSTFECGYEECPAFKKELDDTYVLLEQNNTYILYNYRNNIIISKDYEDYLFINNQYIIVTKDGKQGIIDIDNHIILEPTYNQIGYFQDDYLIGYNLNYIITKKDDKYGIISYKTGKIVEPFNYSEDEINQLLEKIKNENSN